jgi:hypothetical protein
MAGSLSHIVADDGALTFELVETGGDRIEALEECFDLIAYLAKDKATLDAACRALNYPVPRAMPMRFGR